MALVIQWGASSAAGQKAAGRQPKHVPSRPETIAWGEFPIDRPPVITVQSGEVVRLDTLSHRGSTQDQEPFRSVTQR